jgi:hypothetical protein
MILLTKYAQSDFLGTLKEISWTKEVWEEEMVYPKQFIFMVIKYSFNQLLTTLF